jgi:hypothetical protein
MVTFALIIASIPVIKMIGWWMEGGAEPFLAILSIFMYFVLIAMMMAAPAWLAALIFGLICLSAIAAPLMGKVSDKRQHKQIDDVRVQGWSAILERDPMNHAARIALAEVLRKRGDIDLAVQHMEWIIAQSPKMALRVRPQMDVWLREKARQTAPKPIICHECHAENPHWVTACDTCGAQFGTRAGMAHGIRLAGGPKAVVRMWVVASGSIIAVILFFGFLPIEYAAPLAVATLMVGVWLFLRWVGGDMGTVPS